MRCLTTTGESLKTLSVPARSPTSQWKMWLSCLAWLVGAQHGGAGLDGLEGIHHHGQLLVVDLHRGHAVGGGVAVGGDDRRHLLGLVHHLLDGEHHLGVRHQGRHPVELVLLQGLAGDDGEDAGHLQGGRGVDLLDLGVGEGAADDVHVEHPGQGDVVHVVALAADEAGVFLPLHGVAHAADFRGGAGCRGHVALLTAASRPRAPRP